MAPPKKPWILTPLKSRSWIAGEENETENNATTPKSKETPKEVETARPSSLSRRVLPTHAKPSTGSTLGTHTSPTDSNKNKETATSNESTQPFGLFNLAAAAENSNVVTTGRGKVVEKIGNVAAPEQDVDLSLEAVRIDFWKLSSRQTLVGVEEGTKKKIESGTLISLPKSNSIITDADGKSFFCVRHLDEKPKAPKKEVKRLVGESGQSVAQMKTLTVQKVFRGLVSKAEDLMSMMMYSESDPHLPTTQTILLTCDEIVEAPQKRSSINRRKDPLWTVMVPPDMSDAVCVRKLEQLVALLKSRAEANQHKRKVIRSPNEYLDRVFGEGKGEVLMSQEKRKKSRVEKLKASENNGEDEEEEDNGVAV